MIAGNVEQNKGGGEDCAEGVDLALYEAFGLGDCRF
jgi:hypothetical protein